MPQPFTRKKTQQRGASLPPQPYTSDPQTNHLTQEDIEELENLQNQLQQKSEYLTMVILQNKKISNKKNPRTLHRERSNSSRSDSSKFKTKKYDNQSSPTSTSQNSTNSEYSTSQNSQKPKSYYSDTSPSSKHLSNRYSHKRN